MTETRKPETTTSRRKAKPRIIVVREFSGQRSMREAFEQAIENQAMERFSQWKESKKG